MNKDDIALSDIEEFLANERRKLEQDRQRIDSILKLFSEEQQLTSQAHKKEISETEDIQAAHLITRDVTKENIFLDRITNSRNKKGNFPSAVNLSKFAKHEKSITYNSQFEKERLAYLFENAPNFLNLRSTSRKYRHNERAPIHSQKRGFANKENQDPICSFNSNSKPKIHPLKNATTQHPENKKNAKNMVRVGEFSPLNPPSFNSSDKVLFGIGEYEQRRRAFLEKKKQDYIKYLANIKKNEKVRPQRRDDECRSHSLQKSEIENTILSYRKIFTPERNLSEDEELYNCVTRIQQENYRQQLDEQIRMKVKLEEERKKKEMLEEQKNLITDAQHRRDVMKHIEDEFNKRLNLLNEYKRKNNSDENNEKVAETSNDQTGLLHHNENLPTYERTFSHINNEQLSDQVSGPFAKQNIETCSIEDVNLYEKMKKELYKRELTQQIKEKRQFEEERKSTESREGSHHTVNDVGEQVPYYLGKPLMKQNAESCAIDNLEKYEKVKRELYKEELNRQIEEKRKLEEQRKIREAEEERKLDEKLKKDEELLRLREEHEKKQISNNQHLSQKMQGESSHGQELKTDMRNDAVTKCPLKSFAKTPNFSLTNHRFNEKTNVKNVSFAPKAYVYSFDEENSQQISIVKPAISVDRENKNDSIIIEAPYVLAVKKKSNSFDVKNYDQKKLPSPTLPECLPIPPDFRQPIPELGNLPIPPSVSMSEQAVRDYFKTNAFSDLSRIRKILKERQANSNL